MRKINLKEKQDVEFKTKWNDDILKEISAFANTEGGKIYIGVNDAGEILGLKSSSRLLENIPNKTHNILGLILPVNLHKEVDKHYITIEVSKSLVPISFRGKYYQRSGSTKRELTGNELNRFILSFSEYEWETFIQENATFNELDSATIAKFQKLSRDRLEFADEVDSDKEFLEKLGLIIQGKITRAALLLFGKNPQKYLTASILKIGKFDANGELIAQDIITGNLFNQIEKAIEVLKSKYLIFEIKFEGMKRIETLEYPIKALREIMVNALIHKDYIGASIQMKIHPDRLELWNEGELPESIPIAKLFETHPSKPRNELMAKVFFYAEYIDAWGRGISKIIEACKDADLPLPEFKEAYGGLQVTLFKDIYIESYLQKQDINERQIAAIKYLKTNKKISNKIYRKITEVSKATATKELQDLVKKSMISQKGKTGRGTTYVLSSPSKRANKGLKGLIKD